MNIISKEDIKEIRKSLSEGISAKEIAKKFKVHVNTIYYHSSDEKRKHKIKLIQNYYNKLPNQRKKTITKKRLPYMKDYFKKRYWNDEEFRENHIQRVTQRYKEKYRNDEVFRKKELARKKKKRELK